MGEFCSNISDIIEKGDPIQGQVISFNVNNSYIPLNFGWPLTYPEKSYSGVSEFRNRNKEKGNEIIKYNYKEVLDYLKGTKVKCYLTGTPIDLEKDDYCFDHIIPVSKGGTNELSNLGVTIPSANYAKNNLSLEEFFDLCKLVLEYNGYQVIKK